jgi:hypothetical protein
MIQRLVDALRVLAAKPVGQIAFRKLSARPDEVALEFADALLLMESCQQETLADEVLDALRGVEALLDRHGADPAFWSDRAIRSDQRWAELRRRAAEALRLIRA